MTHVSESPRIGAFIKRAKKKTGAKVSVSNTLSGRVMEKLCTVLYVEDDELVRLGLRSLIERVPGMKVVGDAANGQEALLRIEELLPDIVLTDILMPFADGITLTRLVRNRYPSIRVVMLTAMVDESYLTGALNAGASGYILKGSGILELDVALRSAAKGQVYITPLMATPLLTERFIGGRAIPTSKITRRQRQTLELITQGLTTKEIAVSLNIAAKTVEKHRTALLHRLGARNAADLIQTARTHELI